VVAPPPPPQGVLKTHETGILVLDEADDMLADSKADDLQRIAEHCGKRVAGGRQTVVVSATLTDDVLRRLAHICPEPTRLLVTRTGEVGAVTGSSRGLELPKRGFREAP
jgi:superfamily II DNA/RNA helicase